MKADPTLLLLCIAMAFTAPDVCSQGRLQKLLDSSIEQLNQPEHRLNALRKLENLGALAVPEFRKRLHWQKRGELSRQQQVDLLYVVGALAKTGVPALPELMAWLAESDQETVAQLLLTLSELTPHLDGEQLIELGEALRSARAGLQRTALALVLAQTRLGPSPTPQQLVAGLADHENECIAACRKICAQPPQDPDVIRLFLEKVEERLKKLGTRRFLSFGRGSSTLGGELAQTWLVLAARPPTDFVARGLLTHRLPAERLRAVLWLDENGRDRPAEERCDLVVRLWDGDAAVAAATATALGRWQSNGALALPSLRLMAEQHLTPTVQQAAKSAADSIVASFQSLPKSDAEWLLGANNILTDQPAVVPTEPPSDAGKRALAELAMMAQWQTAERLTRLLTFTARSQPSLDSARAVYGWLASKDPPIIDATLSWLACNRHLTIEAMNGLDVLDLTTKCNVLAAYRVPKACRETAFEAGAWLQTADSTSGELRDMLEDGNTRLVARALSELLLRPNKQMLEAVPRLRKLSNLHYKEKLAIDLSRFAEMDRFDYYLSDPVRVLAALALAHAGLVATDDNDLAALVRKHCQCALHELPAEVARRQKDATMTDLIKELETQCRIALYVPLHLRWPVAGKKQPTDRNK